MAKIDIPSRIKQFGSCQVFTYKGKKRAFCKGATGVLNLNQVKKYVKDAQIAGTKTRRVKLHWQKFAKIAKSCQRKSARYPRPKKGQVFRKCMAIETKRAGIKL